MGRPAKPMALHRAQQTFRPDRHADRLGELDVEANGPGKPPKWFSKSQKAAWAEGLAHPQMSKLVASVDRYEFILLCKFAGEIEDGKDIGTEDRRAFFTLCDRFAWNPQARSKVKMPEKPKKSEWLDLASGIPTAPTTTQKPS